MGTEDNLLHPLLPEGNCHKVAAHCQQSREIENSVQQQVNKESLKPKKTLFLYVTTDLINFYLAINT